MKKILAILTIFFTCISMGACKKPTPKPKITGVREFLFEKGKVVDINLLSGVKAVDEIDGDITDKIVYTIQDYFYKNYVQIADIQFNRDYKYEVVYSVVNSKGGKAEKTTFILIGSPNEKVILIADSNGCLATNYEYDYEEVKKDYKLVWQDEFNKKGPPNKDYWEYDTGGGGWGNNEEQYYTSRGANVYISDGSLKIQAYKENYSGSKYTSARIKTKANISYQYGIWEIKAKMPKGAGTWPAIWMLPSGAMNWPIDGEIDIMETAYNGYANKILSTVHTNAYNHKINTQKGSTITTGATIYNDYHLYKVEWLPDKIIGYYDNQPYFIFQPNTLNITCPTYNQWPFIQKFRLIMNIALGGGMGKEINDSIFNEEIAMYVDYVRIYQSDIITNLKPN